MIYNKQKLKIVYQGIDTLVIGVKCNNETIFNTYFKDFKYKLQLLKEEAKNIKSYGDKFVKNDLGLNLGNFLISSKGIQNYSYLFKNDDIFCSVSNSSFNTKNMYHLKVQFRSSFLLIFGYKKAYEFVEKLFKKIFYDNYDLNILRFDICTDVTGIKYTPLDYMNFRTFRKISNFVDSVNYDDYIEDERNLKIIDFTNLDIKTFNRFNRFEGISFGKSPAMFRVYDKIKELGDKQITPLIFKKWQLNGFNFEDDKFVFRHECEFGRDFIKKLIPKCDSEIDFLFENISSFWLKGLSFCKWYDLTKEEIKKIQENDITSKSIQRIYQRVDHKIDRFHFWEFLQTWNSKVAKKELYKQNIEFIPNIDKCKKALKGFISSVYTNMGYIDAFKEVLLSVENDLRQDGLTLHEYGVMKLASKFSDNEKLYFNKQIDNDELSELFNNNLIDFILSLDDMNSPKYEKTIKNALNNFNKNAT